MDIKINKCIKVTLNKCLNMDMKEIKKIIIDSSLKTCHAANLSSGMWKDYYFRVNDEVCYEYMNYDKDDIAKKVDELYNKEIAKAEKKNKDINDKYRSAVRKTCESKIEKGIKTVIEKSVVDRINKEEGKTYANVIEGKMKPLMEDYNTSNVATMHQKMVQGNWNTNKEKILKYECSIPQYRKDVPFHIHGDNYNFIEDNGNLYVEISMFSNIGLSKLKQETGSDEFKAGYKIKFKIDKIDNNKRSTIRKIINGYSFVDEMNALKKKLKDKNLTKAEKEIIKKNIEPKLKELKYLRLTDNSYKQGSAEISISNKGKIELTISFSGEKEMDNLFNSKKILGVDLGIVNTATMIAYDSEACQYDYFSWKHNVIDGTELIKYRQKQHNIRRHRSISSKCVGDGSVGRGRKTRMKSVDKLGNKTSNFADTINHKYSKYIVEFAVRNNCGVIQIEDLTGATANTHERFLKDWSYYDLQNKISYKAKEYGIEVVKVSPKYTSKRCSKCGNIHNDNRDCKNNQAKFECVVCGHKENADINAAKNIAIPNIDKIIDTYIKENKLQNKAS